MHNSTDLHVAFDVAGKASELALAYFEAGVAVTDKSDGSPLTEADVAVELLLRGELGDACPGDAIWGEEYGKSGESTRVWIVDPIDGTGFFAQDDPNWRIHIALQIDDVTELAVVVSPALQVQWWATRHGGAFESPWPRVDGSFDRRLSVSTAASTRQALFEALATPARATLPSGFRPPSSALPLVALVRGEIDGFLAERYFAWDHVPWILLVQEAGGRFTDPAGGSSGHMGGGFYSNAALHDSALQVLGYPPRRVNDG